MWQPQRAARSNRPNTPSDGSKAHWIPYHQVNGYQPGIHLEDFNQFIAQSPADQGLACLLATLQEKAAISKQSPEDCELVHTTMSCPHAYFPQSQRFCKTIQYNNTIQVGGLKPLPALARRPTSRPMGDSCLKPTFFVTVPKHTGSASCIGDE